MTLAVRGKGGHGHPTRVVPLSDETIACLKSYLEAEPHGAGPLLRSRIHHDRGVTSAHIGELVKEVMSLAGVKGTPHAFRHTCATDVLDSCDDILVVRDMLGHVSVRTTEMYTAGRVTHLRAPMAGRTYQGAT
jgi:site-specific recombinase XerD